jgi:hypothetical protein
MPCFTPPPYAADRPGQRRDRRLRLALPEWFEFRSAVASTRPPGMSTLVPPLPPARVGDARGPAGLPQAFNEPCYAFVKYKHRVCAEFAKEAMANQATQRGPFSFGSLPTFPDVFRRFPTFSDVSRRFSTFLDVSRRFPKFPRQRSVRVVAAAMPHGRARGAVCGGLHAARLHASEWTARRTVQPFESNTGCINVR